MLASVVGACSTRAARDDSADASARAEPEIARMSSAEPIDAAPDAPYAERSADAGAMSTCTGALYDPCNTGKDNCQAGACHDFFGRGLVVCTIACDARGLCPLQGQAYVACNAAGLCVPPFANASCTVP